MTAAKKLKKDESSVEGLSLSLRLALKTKQRVNVAKSKCLGPVIDQVLHRRGSVAELQPDGRPGQSLAGVQRSGAVPKPLASEDKRTCWSQSFFHSAKINKTSSNDARRCL